MTFLFFVTRDIDATTCVVVVVGSALLSRDILAVNVEQSVSDSLSSVLIFLSKEPKPLEPLLLFRIENFLDNIPPLFFVPAPAPTSSTYSPVNLALAEAEMGFY